MSFNPKSEYTVTDQLYSIKEFFEYADDFITRPPYQRKSVWSKKKKQDLLDSLFRKYYIPKIVIREVRLDQDRSVSEVVDGQQRITTAQDFFANNVKLPDSLKDVSPDLPGKFYKDLDVEVRRFIDRELKYPADIIKGIDDPKNLEHQKIATDIFWRLQQGESLNFMEIAHARLASLVRNFVVKYADDITFDFDSYKPVEGNKNKHKFFKIYTRDNNRMQHLLLMARLLMLEKAKGATELKDTAVAEFVDSFVVADGVGNDSYEDTIEARAVLSNLSAMYEIFKDDPMIDEKHGLKEMSREYVTLSFYLLLRHLRGHYVFDEKAKDLFKAFLLEEFYPRWSKVGDEDSDILHFSSSRQMDKSNIDSRDQILRQLFFEFLTKQGVEMIQKDENRGFNEAQKIAIYRKDKGLCQVCLLENKPEKEAQVSWKEYEADHIFAHSKGGQTDVDNAQVLCRHHNRTKSNR